MATRMQQRRGTASQWTSANPVLNAGEIGFESDTNKFKIGDGDNHWADLDYFASAAAISDILDGAPATLDTLNELAAALGDDPAFFTTVATNLSNHSSDTTSVHGIADTALLATQEYVDEAVENAEVDQSALAGSGIDWNAGTSQFDIAEDITVENITSNNTIDAYNLNVSGTLTVTGTETIIGSNNLSIKDNIIYLNEAISKEVTNAVGNGTTVTYTVDNSDNSFAVGNAVSVSGITPSALNQSTFVAIQSATTTSFTINKADTDLYVSGGTASAKADVNPDLGIIGAYNDGTYAHSGIVRDSSDGGKWKFFEGLEGEPGVNLDFTTAVRSDIQVGGIYAETGNIDSISANSATIGDVSNTELQYLNGVTSAVQTQIDAKAPLASPTFTGTVGLPENTISESMMADDSVGTNQIINLAVTNGKIAADAVTEGKIADGSVTSAKIATGTIVNEDISSTAEIAQSKIANLGEDLGLKAPLESPTFIGTVVLPSTTSIGDISSTELGYVNGVTSSIQTQIDGKQATVANVSDVEIGYLDGVTSSIQTQLDAKSTDSKTETLTNKTLTSPVINTPTGITKSDVGLGNVDNTADSNKPVSTATQTALDLKLALAGGTMTGAITLHADPSSSLHAATKQYVDNTASGVVAKPQVLGATTANIDATYSNGTLGVGATLTHNTNGAFPAEAGGATGWAVGKGILVKNQTNKAHNGRYFISDMGSASTPYVLTRCTYCDEASEIPGAYIFVQSGTSAGTGWIQVVADPATFVVGTDNIDVFQFSGSGTITAGTNISVSGNEVSVVATPSLSGVTFSDGTQTKEGVPSRTPIIAKTDSYTLSALTERDSLIEVAKASATTITIPLNSAVAFPVGTSLDILQTSTGQVTIAGAAGVTVNATPGLKLRTQWSSCTLFKRAENTWVVYGDLTA
jgi:hypothetical protein